MVEDNPKMNELEELVQFCGKNENPIKGFIMPEIRECDRINEPFPLYNLTDVIVRKRWGKKKLGGNYCL